MFEYKILLFTSVIMCYTLVCWTYGDIFASETPTSEAQDNYVDPHSFYYDKHTQSDSVSSFIQQDFVNKVDRTSCDEQLRTCRNALLNKPSKRQLSEELLFRRMVNMLISRTNFKAESELYVGYLELRASDAEFQALKKFGEEKLSVREIDSILNNVIKTPAYDRLYESAKWTSYVLTLIYQCTLSLLTYAVDHKEIVLPLICTVYVIEALMRMRLRYNLWILLITGISLIFVVSFFITWWKLVQEAEINHSTLQIKHMKMPIHCEPEKMSVWDKFLTLFSSGDDCEKYHEAMMKTPFLQVTPAQALSHMLSHAIYEPLIMAGKALASFLKHLTAGMGWFEGGIVKILLTITFLPVLVICFVLLAGGSLSFGSFGALSIFSLGGRDSTEKRQSKSLESKSARKPIEIMLNITTNGNLHAEPAIELPRSDSSRKLRLKDKPEKEEEETAEIANACPLCLNDNEVGGHGDCKSTKITETESTVSKADVKEFRDGGGGDHALE